MKDNIEKRVIGLFVLLLAIMVYAAWSSVQTIKENVQSNSWVNHTHDVIIHAGDILSYLHAGDAGLRSCLITGDEHDRQDYREAYSTMKERLDEAEALTRAGEEEQPLHQRFLDLQKLISDRIAAARSMVEASKTEGGLEAIRQQFRTHPDLESIHQIERSINNIIEQENRLLVERDKRQHLEALSTRMTVYTGLSVDFVLAALVLWLIRDDLAARNKASRALEEANAQLEAKVRERTIQLVATNHSLNEENLERRWSCQTLDHQLRYNQLIINSMTELVFVVSRALNISRINPAVVRQTNWEPQELIAQSIDRVLQFPQERAGGVFSNPLAAALRDGRQLEERPALLLARSGTTIPVLFNLAPLHDQDKIVGGVVTVRMQVGVQHQSKS
jgi:CHASE3 domain sensor protein